MSVQFYIEYNAFNSGVLAPRVGTLHLQGQVGAVIFPEQEIIEAAAAQNLDLVTMKTASRIDAGRFQFLGELLIYSGILKSINAKLAKLRRRESMVTRPVADMAEIEHLLAFAARTRFTQDPRLSANVVKRHKLKTLAYYQQRFPDYCIGYLSPPGIFSAFQCSFVNGDAFSLYEIIVHPDYRLGFAALELLKTNLEHACASLPEVSDVTTKIYSGNLRSQKFFSGLGLQKTKDREFHYHLWLQPAIKA